MFCSEWVFSPKDGTRYMELAQTAFVRLPKSSFSYALLWISTTMKSTLNDQISDANVGITLPQLFSNGLNALQFFETGFSGNEDCTKVCILAWFFQWSIRSLKNFSIKISKSPHQKDAMRELPCQIAHLFVLYMLVECCVVVCTLRQISHFQFYKCL